MIPRSSLHATVVLQVPDDVLTVAQQDGLDARVRALALGMTLAHPLRAFSPLADVHVEGQILGALIREMQDHPDMMAEITPWLLCK